MILTIAATLLFTFSSVANPYLIGLAENRYIVAGDFNGLNNIVLIFIGMAVLNLISYYTQIRAEALLGQNILLKLRTQLFSHLQRLPLRFFNRNEVGRIMSRVQNDVGELGDFLDSGAFWVIGEVITMISIMVVMFTMKLNLALFTLSVIPLLLLFIIIWQTRARRSFIQVRQSISRVNTALEENITGVRVIQSLSRENLNSKQFEKINRANFLANLRAAQVSAAMMPGVELLVSIATALVILFGGIEVVNRTLLVGTLVAFVLYIQNFFDPVRMLTYEYGQLQRAMASAARIFELLDVKEESEDSTDAGVWVTKGGTIPAPRLRGHIKFEGVFNYEPDIEVLHRVDLDIPAGNMVALVGPTGAGKSTIVNLIARFYDVNEGKIVIDGYDLRNLERTSYMRQIGLVLQDPFLFSGTIRDNIRYGNLEATDEQITTAAKTIGAHEFIMRLAKDYDTELEERGQNLSMGNASLSASPALLADPAILLG
jgi:ATP-binding cassette subfamily B protein